VLVVLVGLVVLVAAGSDEPPVSGVLLDVPSSDRVTLDAVRSAFESAGEPASAVAVPATIAPASMAVRAGSSGLRTRTARERTTKECI
jgi:hypothetical protein